MYTNYLFSKRIPESISKEFMKRTNGLGWGTKARRDEDELIFSKYNFNFCNIHFIIFNNNIKFESGKIKQKLN